jgi:hypothetical protein
MRVVERLTARQLLLEAFLADIPMNPPDTS